jgi:hypothetical protein
MTPMDVVWPRPKDDEPDDGKLPVLPEGPDASDDLICCLAVLLTMVGMYVGAAFVLAWLGA